MIGALGAEIDRLENEIRQLVPGIRHIDLVSHIDANLQEICKGLICAIHCLIIYWLKGTSRLEVVRSSC